MGLGDNTLGDRPDREYWRIDGNPVATETSEETRTYETLELSFHIPIDALEALRELRPNAGSLEVLPRSDGGFVAVDTADGDNTHTVEPPASRQSVRRQITWLCADYDEEMLDQTGDRYEIELELVPTESKRQYSGHTDDSRATDDWLLQFDAGDVATTSVSSEIYETHSDGVETLELEMVLSPPQVRKLEESARKLSAVQVTDQFDGSARAEDNSPEQVNTVYLDPPDGGDKTIDPGHYVVDSWETSKAEGSANVYDVALDVISISPPDFNSSGFIVDTFAAN